MVCNFAAFDPASSLSLSIEKDYKTQRDLPSSRMMTFWASLEGMMVPVKARRLNRLGYSKGDR